MNDVAPSAQSQEISDALFARLQTKHLALSQPPQPSVSTEVKPPRTIGIKELYLGRNHRKLPSPDGNRTSTPTNSFKEFSMPQPGQPTVLSKGLKVFASIAIFLVMSLGLSVISLWQKGKAATIEAIEVANSLTKAQAKLIDSTAEMNLAAAATTKSQAQQAPTASSALRPSEVPLNMRAAAFGSVSSSVQCTSGGTGLDAEGFNKPYVLSSGFELEPGKCFFGKPKTPIKQLEGNNAFMELYDTAGSLKGRCDFSQASIVLCTQLHDQALAGQGVIRFGARHGGFIKYWV